jgi:hypothetical protein
MDRSCAASFSLRRFAAAERASPSSSRTVGNDFDHDGSWLEIDDHPLPRGNRWASFWPNSTTPGWSDVEQLRH